MCFYYSHDDASHRLQIDRNLQTTNRAAFTNPIQLKKQWFSLDKLSRKSDIVPQKVLQPVGRFLVDLFLALHPMRSTKLKIGNKRQTLPQRSLARSVFFFSVISVTKFKQRLKAVKREPIQTSGIKSGARLKVLTLIVVCFCTAVSSEAQYNYFYSPADSILYWDSPGFVYEDISLLRIRNGGAVMERAENFAPGNVGMTDAILGSVYAGRDSLDGLRYWFRSSDYGENWTPEIGVPPTATLSYGGSLPGQCWAERWNPSWPPCLYLTQDSWQTVDSTFVTVFLQGGADSLESIISLSHHLGTLYGLRASDQAICVSSDTGQTWTFGEGYYPSQLTYGVHCGAVDELWWRLGTQVFVAVDTGRTVLGPIFQAHLPDHPPPYNWGWHFNLITTDLPGEAYGIATWDNWPPPPHWLWLEMVVYHIREYGAVVDSFYYAGYDLNFENAVSPLAPIPMSFRVQAYPNPFNSDVTLQWELSRNDPANITIRDMLGRVVWTWYGTGARTTWNGSSETGSFAASGKYFVTVGQRFQERTIPIILIR